MRVGLVIYGPLETVSGGFLYDRKLVDFLRRSGDHVEIISLRWRSYAANLLDNWSRVVGSRLRERDVDVMLQDELCHPSLFWLSRRPQRYPTVSVVHHLRSSERRPEWSNRLYRWVETRYLRSVDGYVYNSEATRASVEALVTEERPSVTAHPGGDQLRPNVTAAEVEARAMAPGPLRVVFVGNVIQRKEPHTLIAALARLPREDFRLDIVGSHTFDPDYVRAIRRQVSAAGMDSQVALAGPLLAEALAERLRASHVLAVPSSHEGFGIAYVEGMGAGLPAIATTAGGASEIIEHGGNGFLVAPGDVEALSRHLSELGRDRDRLARMGVQALESYANHPTWDDTASRIRQFLCSLVS